MIYPGRCAIFLTPEPKAGCCDGCGDPLPGRRRRWCSDACWTAYFTNHGWTAARHEALRRATVSVPEERPAVRWNKAKWRSEPTGEMETIQVAVWRPCDNCGLDTLEGSHVGAGRWVDHQYVVDPARLDVAAEVNHVEPRNGDGYDGGCWNHQTNLQVLCHRCHVDETTDQVRARLGLPPRPARIEQLPTIPLGLAAA